MISDVLRYKQARHGAHALYAYARRRLHAKDILPRLIRFAHPRACYRARRSSPMLPRTANTAQECIADV